MHNFNNKYFKHIKPYKAALHHIVTLVCVFNIHTSSEHHIAIMCTELPLLSQVSLIDIYKVLPMHLSPFIQMVGNFDAIYGDGIYSLLMAKWNSHRCVSNIGTTMKCTFMLL